METIFRREDFQLCNLPVPSGYPYAPTHCGVAYSEKGLGGFHWFFVSSPYPNPKRSLFERAIRYAARKVFHVKIKPSDWYENPMLYWGGNEDEIPTSFIPYPYNPLMETPEDIYGMGAFNSDPDIFMEGETLYILNRPTWRKPGNDGCREICSKLYMVKVLYEEEHFVASDPHFILDYPKANASPSLIFYNGKYRIFSLISNSYNTGEPCEYVEMRESDAVDGNYDVIKRINVTTRNYQPWHFSVFTYKDRLFSIVACTKGAEKQRCYQMLGVFSNDLSEFHVYQTPLSNMKSYRGSATVLPNGELVLYTSIIEPFHGSRSVDGRDILVARGNFESILKIMKESDEKSIDLW